MIYEIVDTEIYYGLSLTSEIRISFVCASRNSFLYFI